MGTEPVITLGAAADEVAVDAGGSAVNGEHRRQELTSVSTATSQDTGRANAASREDGTHPKVRPSHSPMHRQCSPEKTNGRLRLLSKPPNMYICAARSDCTTRMLYKLIK